MSLTRRDCMVALVAIAATACTLTLSGQKPVLGSTVFDLGSIAARKTASGSMQPVISSPTATLENLEIHVTTLNPGMEPHKPHHHPNEELILLQRGTLETLSNGSWKRVNAGSIIFNGSNQTHGLRNVGTDPAVYFVVNVKTAATPAATPAAVPAK